MIATSAAQSLERFLADETEPVNREVSPNDEMFRAAPDHYFHWGRASMRTIAVVLRALGRDDVRRILDFPCGHGRALRMFAAALPEAELTACDIDRDGVDFCARTFGATPVYSDDDPARIEIEGPFDLIWCGSLLTHLDHRRWTGLLDLFESLLAPEGVLVFTTHGETIVRALRSGTLAFKVRSPLDLIAHYELHGFGYQDSLYADARTGWGISLSAPAWVCRFLEQQPGLDNLLYLSAGWNRHHDVFACGRS